MPEGVLPSVPGIAPVGLSRPGVGVDCCGRGGAGEAEGSNGAPIAGGVDGVRPPPGAVVPGGRPMPWAPTAGPTPVPPVPTPPVPMPPPGPPVAPPAAPVCANAGVESTTPAAATVSIVFKEITANVLGPRRSNAAGPSMSPQRPCQAVDEPCTIRLTRSYRTRRHAWRHWT